MSLHQQVESRRTDHSGIVGTILEIRTAEAYAFLVALALQHVAQIAICGNPARKRQRAFGRAYRLIGQDRIDRILKARRYVRTVDSLPLLLCGVHRIDDRRFQAGKTHVKAFALVKGRAHYLVF